MSRIVGCPVDFQDKLWGELPDGKIDPDPLIKLSSYEFCISARNLVGKLLIHNPMSRETVTGALSSRWILVELQDLMEGYKSRVGPRD